MQKCIFGRLWSALFGPARCVGAHLTIGTATLDAERTPESHCCRQEFLFTVNYSLNGRSTQAAHARHSIIALRFFDDTRARCSQSLGRPLFARPIFDPTGTPLFPFECLCLASGFLRNETKVHSKVRSHRFINLYSYAQMYSSFPSPKSYMEDMFVS